MLFLSLFVILDPYLLCQPEEFTIIHSVMALGLALKAVIRTFLLIIRKYLILFIPEFG